MRGGIEVAPQPGIDDGKPFRLACASVGVIHFQKEDL
jgi:hypothetical protein